MFKEKLVSAALCLLPITLAFCAAACGPPGSTVVDCTPTFSASNGWLGGDAAYSIPIDATRSLWVFGDTFVGSATQTSRVNATMVHNSIGISTCDHTTGAWSINYTWNGVGTAAPSGFFNPPAGANYWFWPIDGFVANGNSYVTLWRVQSTPGVGLGFSLAGITLAEIAGAIPESATVTYQNLSDSTTISPGTSAVVNGDQVYLYSSAPGTAGTKAITLARIALSGLADAKNNLQYLAVDGTWKPGQDVADSKILFEGGVTEMTVKFHSDLGKWVAVHSEATFPSSRIMMRTAAAPEGPWSPPTVIYNIPEMNPQTAGYDSTTYCYAGKEHPELTPDGSGIILFTYVCNSTSLSKLVDNMSIYFPRAGTSAD